MSSSIHPGPDAPPHHGLFSETKDHQATVDAVMGLCKRRGFLYPATPPACPTPPSPVQTLWDYGPLGVALRDNIAAQWRQVMVQHRDDVVELDSSILVPTAGSGKNEAGKKDPGKKEPGKSEAEKAEDSSGGLSHDAAWACLCQSCHRPISLALVHQSLAAAGEREHDVGQEQLDLMTCPACGTRGALTPPQQLNTVLSTFVGHGPDIQQYQLRQDARVGLLRQFLTVAHTARKKPPFGIAHRGRCFTNGFFTAGQPQEPLIGEACEFQQLQMYFFAPPGTEHQWHNQWSQLRHDWYGQLGLNAQKMIAQPTQSAGEQVFYRLGAAGPTANDPDNKGQCFQALNPPDSTVEDSLVGRCAPLETVSVFPSEHLKSFSEHTGVQVTYFDQDNAQRWVPCIVETSMRIERVFMAFLLDAFSYDQAPNAKGQLEQRTVLRLDPRLAPVTVAVLPLSRNADLSPKAREVAAHLRRWWTVEFDDSGAIGRRYRRQDEIGTPFCLTVDFDTLVDEAVTIRHRDSMRQERVGLDAVAQWLRAQLEQQ